MLTRLLDNLLKLEHYAGLKNEHMKYENSPQKTDLHLLTQK